jgi:FAD/FMN-containing dehydrogenase
MVRASIDGRSGGRTRAELDKDLFAAKVALVQGAGGPLGVVHVLELDVEIAPEVRPVVPAHLHTRDAAKTGRPRRCVRCVRCVVRDTKP